MLRANITPQTPQLCGLQPAIEKTSYALSYHLWQSHGTVVSQKMVRIAHGV